MREEINLVTIDKKPEKKISSFFSLSLLTLLLTVVVAVISILYLFFLKTQLISLSNDKEQTLLEIQRFDEQRVKLLTVKERLSAIGKIIPGNQVLPERVRLLRDGIPAEFEVSDMIVDLNKVTITMSSQSLSLFNTFFDTKLEALAQKKRSGISGVKIQGFGFSPQNTFYSSKIDFTFSAPNN